MWFIGRLPIGGKVTLNIIELAIITIIKPILISACPAVWLVCLKALGRNLFGERLVVLNSYEIDYNRNRRHSANAFVSPEQFEEKFVSKLTV